MPLKTSLLISGDSTTAVKATEDLSRSVETLGTKAQTTAAALDKQTQAVTTAAGAAEAIVEAQSGAADAMQRAATSAADASGALGSLASANDNVAKSSGNASVASAVLQSVIRKTVDQFSAGASISTIFAEHVESVAEILELFAATRAPKAASASAELGEGVAAAGEEVGLFSTVLEGAAGFLTGGWGIALTAGIGFVSPFIAKLFDTEDAGEKAKAAIDDVTGSIRDMGTGIDQETGKLDVLNSKLALAARLKAAATRPDLLTSIEDQSKQIFDTAASASSHALLKEVGGTLTFGLGSNVQGDYQVYAAINQALADANGNANLLVANIERMAAANPNLRPLAKQLADQNSALAESKSKLEDLNVAEGRYDTVAQGGQLLTRQSVELEIQRATATDKSAKAALGLTIAQQNLNTALSAYQKSGPTAAATAAVKAAQEQVIAAQKVVDAVQSTPHQRATPKISDPTATINGLSNEAANDIATYGSAPTFLAKANEELAKLQQGLDKLATLKPRSPLDAAAIGAATQELEKAGIVISSNLDKPFNDFIRSQNESLAVIKLQTEGQVDQAATLQQIIALQAKMGPLDAAHVAAIEVSTEKLDDARKAQERLNAARQEDLAALTSIQEQITGILGGTTSLAGGAKGIFSAFKQLSGQQLFGSILGPAFQSLRDEVSGGVTGVTAELKASIAAVDGQVDNAGKALGDFTDAVTSATSRIVTGGDPLTYNQGALDDLASLPTDIGNGPLNPAIVVAGKDIKDAANIQLTATELFNKTGNKIGTTIGGMVDDLTGTNGVFAKALGSIGSHLGDALKGAGIGSAIGSVLGLSSTGSTIGGALGNVLGKSEIGKTIGSSISTAIGGKLGSLLGSAVPVIGSVLGSVAGGLLGSLFSSTKKSSSTLAFANGSYGAGTTTGTSSGLRETASNDASGVGSALNSLAKQLGVTLGGNASVSIGTRNGKYVVDTFGEGRTKGVATDSFASEQDAIKFAISDAIGDGVFKGLSKAENAALLANKSDPDAAAAAVEQVKQVEQLIGGVGETLKETFATFDTTAAQNLATAKQYGLDIVAVEKASADARTKLIDDTLKQQVGSLQDFVQSTVTGDLAEGSASDKLAALRGEIASVKAKADSGDTDAISSLSDLYSQLISDSKDANGTAGGAYAADRATAISGATSVIQEQTDRINQAAGLTQATTDAVNANTTVTDETNDLLAQQTSVITNLPAAIAAAIASIGKSSAISTNIRTSLP